MHVEFPVRGKKLWLSAELEAKLAGVRSEYQLVEVVRTEAFGKALLLDGHIQLTELDEHAYHEGLVQVPLMSLPKARRALVVGGGDGGVIREICRHARIEHVDMVEIDPVVVQVCREHLPEVSAGAFDDPRVHLHIQDAFPFVQQEREPYDLVIVDSTDHYEDEEGQLSEMLFTERFYQDCKRLLTPGGMVVTQADNLLFCPYSLESIATLLGGVFPRVGSYWVMVPSFGGVSGYCWASFGARPVERWSEMEGPSVPLRYLDETTWNLAFRRLPFGL